MIGVTSRVEVVPQRSSPPTTLRRVGVGGLEGLATRKPVNTANVIPACRQLRCVWLMDLCGGFNVVFLNVYVLIYVKLNCTMDKSFWKLITF